VAGANNVSLLEVLQEDGPPRSLDASDPVTVVAIINKSQQVVVYRIMNGKLISVSCALKVEEAGVLPTRFCSPLTNLLQHGVRKVLDTPYDGGVEKVPAILHQGEQVSVIALWRSRKSSLGVRRPEEIAISVLFTEECNSMPLRDYNSIKDTELFSVFEKRLSQCRK
jgi:hypothetical protein